MHCRHNGPLMKKDLLLKCVENKDITSEFMDICRWLTNEIQVFSGVIEKITGRYKCFFSF